MALLGAAGGLPVELLETWYGCSATEITCPAKRFRLSDVEWQATCAVSATSRLGTGLKYTMRNLHSIYFDHADKGTAILPQKIVRNLASFQECHKDSIHRIYNLDMARAFIGQNYDQSVLAAFDSLRPLAYKADLFRYCLLYELGGIYADLSLYFHSPVIECPSDTKLLVFRDVSSHAPWILSNSLIAAKPGLPVFTACIDSIVEHVRNDYYGVNPLCPTGPNLFGAQLARTTCLSDLISGDVVQISRDGSRSYAYLLPNGRAAAVAIKKGAGLSSLGAMTSEDYNKLYHMRAIYNHNDVQKSWMFDEFVSKGWLGKHSADGIFGPGIAVFGPYVTLPKGRYTASFIVSPQTVEAISQVGLTVDVCANSGQLSIATYPTIDVRNDSQTPFDCHLVTDFELSETLENIEVRLHLKRAAAIKFKGLRIIPRD